jgi:glyoxylase-like metal-dependent hydrolase (beta-lactamase superfamily II)
VTYLPDGEGHLDSAFIFPASAPHGWAPHAHLLDADGRFPVSIGSFLIRTAGRVLLVDLGLGRASFEIPAVASYQGGRLLESLAAEGLDPADVDTVFFTHLHHDHVGWTTDVAPAPDFPDGAHVEGLTFSRARHLVAESEWDYWTDNGTFPGPDARAVQAPLAERIQFVGDGAEIAPGVRVLATPGHTPGHHSLVVADPAGVDPRRLVILGDVMHCQVQVTESHWSFVFDVDDEQAVHTREQLLKELEDPDTLLAGGHFADHVFGRVLPPAPRRAWADGRVLGVGIPRTPAQPHTQPD